MGPVWIVLHAALFLCSTNPDCSSGFLKRDTAKTSFVCPEAFVIKTTAMPAFVQHPEEFYRRHDKTWDDHYQASAREASRVLASLSETSSSFRHFKKHVRSKIDQRAPKSSQEPKNPFFLCTSGLFSLLLERCPSVLEDGQARSNYEFLLLVAEHDALPFAEVSIDLMHNIYSQEYYNNQATPLTHRLRGILRSVTMKCNMLEKQIVSSELDGSGALNLASFQTFKDGLRTHLNEIDDVVAAYVEMMNRMYIFPLLKYGKYSRYFRRANDLVANQFNIIISVIECLMSLCPDECEGHPSPSFGACMSKLSIDMLIRQIGCELDYGKVLAPRRRYILELLQWIRSVTRCIGKGAHRTDTLWKRIHDLPERMSHVNPFSTENGPELQRLQAEVENLRADVNHSSASECMSELEIRMKLEELDELTAVLSKLQDKCVYVDVCMSPSVEDVQSALDCISEIVEELKKMPEASLSPDRIEDLKATLAHQSTRLSHARDCDLHVFSVDALRLKISILGARLEKLELAKADIHAGVLALVTNLVSAYRSIINVLRKLYHRE